MRDEIARRLFEYFDLEPVEGVLSVYLFGSQAADTGHKDSDIDVAVLLDRVLLPTRLERDQTRVEISSSLIEVCENNLVDVVSLEDAPPELGRRVVTDGSRVFCASEEADHAFVRDVQLRAADLDPFLRRMRALTLQALRS